MLNIRELTQEDNDAYRDLWLYGITEHANFFRIAPEDGLPKAIPTHFKPDSQTLGAFSDTNLIGIVSFERDSRAKAHHKALISRMFVHPNAAGQGIGKALLIRTIDLAKDLGDLRYLYLTVLATNLRAISLYTSLNFVEFAREPGAVLIGSNYVDELQMAHSLSGS